jgi:hypothetical protein
MDHFVEIEPNSYFPMCFDCQDEEEFKEFLEYYKLLLAECALKRYVKAVEAGECDKRNGRD